MLLVAGFFVCGFHLAFITIHLPKYLVDHGISNAVGGWVMALIGLFNLVGSLLAGYWSGKVSKPYLLSAIYLARAVLIVGFVLLPLTPVTALAFGAGIGLLWLSTVPPTSGLVLVMFGPRWMAMLFGVVFLSHQIGSFLGVWLAGLLYESTGSYDVVWWLGVALGLFAALVHLPIGEAAGGSDCAGVAQLDRRPTTTIQWRGDAHDVQGDPGRQGRGRPERRPRRFRRGRADGRRRHGARQPLDGELQGRARDDRQGAGGAPLADDPRHRLRRRGREPPRTRTGSPATPWC